VGISWLGRQWDQAIEQTQKTLELDPSFAAAWWIGARSCASKRIPEAAIAYSQEAIKLSGGNLFFVADLGHAYAAAGKRGEALEVLGRLQETSKQRYVNACFIANIYVALNENEEALQCLEDAYQERSAWMAYLEMDPWFDPLRSDSRFQDLLRRVKSRWVTA